MYLYANKEVIYMQTTRDSVHPEFAFSQFRGNKTNLRDLQFYFVCLQFCSAESASRFELTTF